MPEPSPEAYAEIQKFLEELNEKGMSRLVWIAMEMEARQAKGMARAATQNS